MKRTARCRAVCHKPPMSLELLDARIVLTGSPYDVVTFDVSTGEESIIPYIGGPQDGATEGGQGGQDFDLPALSFPEGHTPHEPQESVFGNDDRVLISNPTVSPYQRHGSMRMLKNDGNWSFCSGSLIGPSHFLTAGHCVHDGGAGGSWFSNIQVTLGRDGDERWYGAANSTGVTSVVGWTQNGDWEYDWAVIELDRNLGNHTGWNGWWWYSNDSTLDGMAVSIAGYPSDLATQWSQATLQNDTHQIEMYESTGNMLAPTSHQLRYNGTLDTFGGMSGSSVIENKPSVGRVAVGIHAYGGGSTNEATRMREPMSDIIDDLRAHPAPTDRPDLITWDTWFDDNTSFMTRTSARPGDSMSITTYPRNNGTATAGNYTVSFYASTNTIISSGDYFLGSVGMGTLSPFTWDTATLNMTVPDSVPEGTYNIGWIIDSGSNVTEFLENNNTGYIDTAQLTINKALPDTWVGGAEGYAYVHNTAGGNTVNDTVSVDAFLNFNGDIDSYYFAPQFSGNYLFSSSDIEAAVNPSMAVYNAATGAKLGWGDNFLFGDDPLLSLSLNSWERYIIAVADHEEDNVGDVTVYVSTSSQSSAGTVAINPTTGQGGTGGLIDAAGDVDFYNVTAPADATSLTVTLSPVSPLDGVVVLWDDSGNELARADSWGVGTAESISLGAVVPGSNYTATVFSRNYATAGNFNLAFDFDLAGVLVGDFNSDGNYDCADIDALVAVIAAGSNNLTFDMNGDSAVDGTDLTEWLAVAGAANLPSGNPYLPGDANLDGTVNGQDFLLWNTNKFATGTGWCGGDFNADGVTNGQDFLLWNTFKFQAALVLAGDGDQRDPTADLIELNFTDPPIETPPVMPMLAKWNAPTPHGNQEEGGKPTARAIDQLFAEAGWFMHG